MSLLCHEPQEPPRVQHGRGLVRELLGGGVRWQAQVRCQAFGARLGLLVIDGDGGGSPPSPLLGRPSGRRANARRLRRRSSRLVRAASRDAHGRTRSLAPRREQASKLRGGGLPEHVPPSGPVKGSKHAYRTNHCSKETPRKSVGSAGGRTEVLLTALRNRFSPW